MNIATPADKENSRAQYIGRSRHTLHKIEPLHIYKQIFNSINGQPFRSIKSLQHDLQQPQLPLLSFTMLSCKSQTHLYFLFKIKVSLKRKFIYMLYRVSSLIHFIFKSVSSSWLDQNRLVTASLRIHWDCSQWNSTQ